MIEGVSVLAPGAGNMRLETVPLPVWDRTVENQIGPDGLFTTDTPRIVGDNDDTDTVYVSGSTGNDGNAGTFAAPKATVQAGIDLGYTAGKGTAIMDDSIYREALTLKGRPLFALAGKNPTLKGGAATVSNFSNIDTTTNRAIRAAITGPSGALYLATNNGLYKSTDSGATWSAFASLSGKDILSLSVSGSYLVILNDTDALIQKVDEAGTKTTIGSSVPAGRKQAVGIWNGEAALVCFGAAAEVRCYTMYGSSAVSGLYAEQLTVPNIDNPPSSGWSILYSTDRTTMSKISVQKYYGTPPIGVISNPFSLAPYVEAVWQAVDGNVVIVQRATSTGYGTLSMRSSAGALLYSKSFAQSAAVTSGSVVLSPSGSEIYLGYLTSTTQRLEKVSGSPWTGETGAGGNTSIAIEAAARVTALFGAGLIGISNANGSTRYEVLSVSAKHIQATASSSITGVTIDTNNATAYTFETGAYGIDLAHCHMKNAQRLISTTGRTLFKRCLIENYTAEGAKGITVGGPGVLEECIAVNCGSGALIESLALVKRCLITGNVYGLINNNPSLVIEDSIIAGNSAFDLVANQPCEIKNSVIGSLIGDVTLTDCLSGNPVLDAEFQIADKARGSLYDSLALGLAADGRDAGAWDVTREATAGTPIVYVHGCGADKFVEGHEIAGLTTAKDQGGRYSEAFTGHSRYFVLDYDQKATPRDDGRLAFEWLRYLRSLEDQTFLFGFGTAAGWRPRWYGSGTVLGSQITIDMPAAPGQFVGYFLAIAGTAYEVLAHQGGDPTSIVALDDTPGDGVVDWAVIFIPVKIGKIQNFEYKPGLPTRCTDEQHQFDTWGQGYQITLPEAALD